MIVKDDKCKITCNIKDEVSGDTVRDVISMAKNSCEKGKLPESGGAKKKGIAEKDLKSLKEKFEVVQFQQGQVVQKEGTKVKRIGYVLEGSVAVKGLGFVVFCLFFVLCLLLFTLCSCWLLFILFPF